MNPEPPTEPTLAANARKRRNWLHRRIESLAQSFDEILRDPRSLGRIAHDAALGIWGSRGGGFYGLGYLVTFVVLEIRMFTADVATSDSVVGFLGQELLSLFFRFAFESILNSFLSLLWPAFVLQLLGGWGIVVLVAGWWGYGRWAAPFFARRGLAPPPKPPKPSKSSKGE